jgi:hypothetical protein
MDRDHSDSEDQDKLLRCEDCGTSFLFCVGEQRFFASRQFPAPKRCKACRSWRREGYPTREAQGQRNMAQQSVTRL